MIRVGVGGWTFALWRDNFYPKGLKHAGELAYAAGKLSAIEINGTFYRAQSPASFAKWRDETPDDFLFTVKGHRAVVNARRLADSGDAIGWFLQSGVLELKEKLGPLLWQLAPFKKFDAADIDAFFALLPREVSGLTLRHAIEVRSPTFLVPEFIDLARKHDVAVVFADSDDYPMVADVTGGFVYARLQRCAEDIPTGYPADAFARWAKIAKQWEAGREPEELPRLAPKGAAKKKRDVFIFMISGAKVRAPAAAMALIAQL